MKLFRWGFDFFFGSFLLYQDKRNEHNKGIAKQRYLKRKQDVKIQSFQKIVGIGF